LRVVSYFNPYFLGFQNIKKEIANYRIHRLFCSF
jgi:hypothetical protein